MSVKLRHLGHATFELVLPSGRVLLIDPSIQYDANAAVKLDELTGADYIAVTEDSYVGVADIVPLVKKFKSKIICTHHVGECLHGRPFVDTYFHIDYANIVKVRPGDVVDFEDLKIEVKRSEHISLLASFRLQYRLEHGVAPDPSMTVADLRKFVTPMRSLDCPEKRELNREIEAAGMIHQGEQLNFVFQTKDNVRIYSYRSGIYDFLRPEIISGHPNVFIAQLSGNEPTEIAEYAALSGAEIVIPSHHDVRGPVKEKQMTEMMEKRLAELSPKTIFLNLQRGRWYEVGMNLTAL